MRILTKEEIDAYNQGIRDAKAGLPCDASSTRVTATYYGKYVNDYYDGYTAAEAGIKLHTRYPENDSTVVELEYEECLMSEDAYYESAWA
tara:strand:+ start:66 stop:335 length:270 start_codon:yes stop_codon:yes gene_type:complete